MTDSSTSPSPHFPKGKYAALMALACVVAVIAAWGIAQMMGGAGSTPMLAALCVGAASMVTFLPVLFATSTQSGGTTFGVMVFGTSMARTLLLLGIALVFSQARELTPRPFWIGIMAGGGVVLLVESWLAITMLARLEKHRTAGPVART